MREYKSAKQLFKLNFFPIIVFEVMYRLVSLTVLMPILYTMLNLSVKAAKIKCLTSGTIAKYLRSPATYGMLLCILFVFAIYILINISGILYAMECSRKGQKTNPLSMLLRGIVNTLRVFRPSNIRLLGYVLFVLPFAYTVMISGSLMGVRIPDFLTRFIIRNRLIMAIILIVYLVFCAISIVKLYSLNYFFLYRVNYKEACQLSKATMKNRVRKTLVEIIILNLLFTVVLVLLEAILAAVTAGVMSVLIKSKSLYFVFNTTIKIIIFGVYMIFAVTATPYILAHISSNFYRAEKKVDYKSLDFIPKKRRFRRNVLTEEQVNKRNRMMIAVLIALSLTFNAVYIILLKANVLSIHMAYSTKASVTAHRGDSKNAPENTMAAFRLAVENQADIIEIDVRQTGDGKYVVLHDENLHRTTNVDVKVGLVTYDYIKTLDAGSKFSKEYKGERIPLFEEVLQFALENDVFLNIELKPAKTDYKYEEGIVELIEQYDFVDKCVVASSDYNLLGRVKALNENIKTVYIMHMALGEFGDMENVDIFSIRHNFISDNMVRNIHKSGKKVYAWTVNSESDIKELLLMDVDSIITDDPYNTKTIIYNANDSLVSDWLQRLVKKY